MLADCKVRTHNKYAVKCHLPHRGKAWKDEAGRAEISFLVDAKGEIFAVSTNYWRDIRHKKQKSY